MDWHLIEAPNPNSPEGKYKSHIPTANNLLQVAAALKHQGHSVQLYNFLHDRRPPLVYGDNIVLNIFEATCMDYYANYALDYLKTLRMFNPQSVIRLIGFYPWLHRSELEAQGFKVADPLYFERDIAGCDGEFPTPWQMWNFEWSPTLGKTRRVTIRAQRGCPRSCSECPVYLVYHQRMRSFSIDWVLNEIRELYSRGIREIGFLDDNLCVNSKWVKQILNSIIEQKFKGLHFTFEEGLEVYQALDDELLTLLKKAGFYHIKLGVESFNPAVLKFIGKSYTDPQMAIAAIKNLQRYKLNPTCFLCFGFPSDTEESIRATIDRVCELNVKLRVQLLFYYPGISFNPCPIPAARLKQLKDEAMVRTNSCSWRKSKSSQNE